METKVDQLLVEEARRVTVFSFLEKFLCRRLKGDIARLENERNFLAERLETVAENAKETNLKLQKSWIESAQSSKLAKQSEELYIKLRQLSEERSSLEAKVCDSNSKLA